MIWRRLVFLALCLGCVCCLSMGTLCSAGEVVPRAPKKLSSSEVAALFQAKEKQILADLHGRQAAPWEGSFSRSTFDSSKGWLISASGYVSTGKVLDLGTVQSLGTRIRLVSQSPFTARDDDRDSRELIVVPWGKRTYLVEPEEMIEFCNRVNSGEEASPIPPFLLFYMKTDSPRERPTGFPRVPKEFKNYLLKQPISASVIRRHQKRDGVLIVGQPFPMSGIPVTVNAGSRNGVRLGMRFLIQDDPLGGAFYVISASEKESELLFVGLLPKDEKKVHVGLTLATRDSSLPR